MEMENKYASKGVAGTGLGLAIGALGAQALGGQGILGNLFGNGCNNGNGAYVNRYELSLQNEITNKDMEIAFLRGRDAAKTDSIELYKYVDGKFSAFEQELCAQRVYNATNTAAINCINAQIAQLMSLTKIVIPNTSVCPGWGNVTVTPATAAAA
jgi:hypothetical protein